MQLSNLTIRVLTAIVGIPIILLAAFQGGVPFLVLILLFSTMAQFEFYRMIEIKGAKPLKIIGLISGVFIVISFFQHEIGHLLASYEVYVSIPSIAELILIVLIISIIIILIIEMFRNNGSPILNVSSTLFGILYIPLFIGTLVGIRESFNLVDFPIEISLEMLETSLEEPIERIHIWGGYTVVSIFAIIWICDTMAYFGGKLFGKNKLFERVSPNKTWEGAILGFIFSLVSAMIAKYLFLDYLTLIEAITIGFIIGTVGQIGDLIESLIKRDVGLKDSSSLIPGHGGFFDRFDSLILASPVLYLYFELVILK